MTYLILQGFQDFIFRLLLAPQQVKENSKLPRAYKRIWELNFFQKTLLFLKYNLRALSYETILDTPPDEFRTNPPNSRSYDEADDKDNDDDTPFEGF